MAGLVDILTSTYTYSVIAWLLGPLWTSAAGRIFLVTGLVYFMSYLVYGSYLSHFAGGFGGLTFSRLGVQPVDLLTLFPTAILAVTDTVIVILREIPARRIIFFFLLFLAPYLFGIPTGEVLQDIIQTKPISGVTVFRFGLLLYFVGVIALVAAYLFGARWYVKVFWALVQGAGLFLAAGALRVPPALIPQQPTAADFAAGQALAFLWELAFLLFVVLVMLLPLLLGKRMAEIAVEKRVLTRVSRLVLTEPLPTVQQFECSTQEQEQLGVATYASDENAPLYLLALFQGTAAFFVPQHEHAANNRMILIDREFIQSMEFSG